MTPYYQDSTVTIYHGDCREVLPTLNDIDLILTDPPYGVNLEYWDEYKDDPAGIKKLVTESLDLMRKFPLVMLTPGIRRIWDYPKPEWMFCWHKPASVGRNDLGGFNSWEPILVYGKKRIYKDFYYATTGHEEDTGDHPCPKPIKLFQQLIQESGCENICDPFMGSGTALRAAKNLNKKATGIEIDEHYCEIAAKRMAQEVFEFS